MRQPIRRILDAGTPDYTGMSELIRQAVIDKFVTEFGAQARRPMLDVWVEKRADYYAVKVFVAGAELLDQAKEIATEAEEELAQQGIQTIFYVESWSGTGATS